MYVVLTRSNRGVTALRLDDAGSVLGEPEGVAETELPAWVGRVERERPRWVWDDSTRWYPALLAAGVRVERCVDLRLSHQILRASTLTAASALANAPLGPWDNATPLAEKAPASGALFDFDVEPATDAPTDPVAEFALQREAVAGAAEPGRIGLLLAAESAGALIACEIKAAGLPVRADVHEGLLAELLGDRPRGSERPARLEELLERMRAILGTHDVNPDSPAELLKALRRGGLQVASTRSWELKEVNHPVVAPLLEYKKLSRLQTANGWNWLDTWVADGRFRPDYVPGGTATGRWGASGGGALQLPKQVRGAVVADPGWKLVVADAAQLEPRVLSALSADRAMAEAGRGDLYEGIVASGAVKTRAEAKVAMLGAMYGATAGDGGRLMPALTRAFPQAIAMVEGAARTGERGGTVTTRLGRSSPPPGEAWRELQEGASVQGASDALQRAARTQSRSWGRFTRNFIVQGTAAEWALCWMAGLRGRLWSLGTGQFADRPHLVFFLHDEVIVHTPAELADSVVDELRAAASEAGRLIFGGLPVDFPITTAVVDNYGQAK
ncbi:bifunctional 3'-5' exonuclease/DNA polymerase [Conyzicola nivalis]|uniref:DNA-directed DNA polymerase n=1 Tax=Conyzicola nivalis TaxID=1477021 RepID=A0A916WH86_9MICO|nr:bifunctional 3'-5' exonuclease/DNA polymerase [Conyzicola nivalis]GGA97439.1 bifunctional 3'-5' exonuclease/DNA polymerase [Conyzicola nivalis]